MTQLNKEFHIMAGQARQRLVEIVQEQSAETLAAFLREKGLVQPVDDKPGGNLPAEPIIQDDGSLQEFLNDFDIFQTDALPDWVALG